MDVLLTADPAGVARLTASDQRRVDIFFLPTQTKVHSMRIGILTGGGDCPVSTPSSVAPPAPPK